MDYDPKELRDGEVWMCNRNIAKKPTFESDLSHLKTLRLGEQAYDIHGKPISTDYMRPIFIHKSEEPEYNRVLMERMRKQEEHYYQLALTKKPGPGNNRR